MVAWLFFYRVWLIGKEFQNSKDTQKFKELQASSSVSRWDSLGQNLLPHTQLEQSWVPTALCFVPPWKSSSNAIDLCSATELGLQSICSLGLSGASFESQFNCCWLQREDSDPRNSHFYFLLYSPLLIAGWEKQPQMVTVQSKSGESEHSWLWEVYFLLFFLVTQARGDVASPSPSLLLPLSPMS